MKIESQKRILIILAISCCGYLFAEKVRADGNFACFQLAQAIGEDQETSFRSLVGKTESYHVDSWFLLNHYELVLSASDLGNFRIEYGDSSKFISAELQVPADFPISQGSRVRNAISPDSQFAVRFDPHTGKAILLNLPLNRLSILLGGQSFGNLLWREFNLPKTLLQGSIQLMFVSAREFLFYSADSAQYALYRINVNHRVERIGVGILLNSPDGSENLKRVVAVNASSPGYIKVRSGDGKLFRIALINLQAKSKKTVAPNIEIPSSKELKFFVPAHAQFVQTKFGNIEIPILQTGQPLKFYFRDGSQKTIRVYPDRTRTQGVKVPFRIKDFAVGGTNHEKLAVLTSYGMVLIFDIATAKKIAAFFPKLDDGSLLGTNISKIGFNPNGELLFVSHEQGTSHFVYREIIQASEAR